MRITNTVRISFDSVLSALEVLSRLLAIFSLSPFPERFATQHDSVCRRDNHLTLRHILPTTSKLRIEHIRLTIIYDS
jgi:hypothetical protein